LSGDPGDDALSGGEGDDFIVATTSNPEPGERDTVDCGKGDDVVIADSNDEIAANCERVLQDLDSASVRAAVQAAEADPERTLETFRKFQRESAVRQQ
jgi:hypothetical protein